MGKDREPRKDKYRSELISLFNDVLERSYISVSESELRTEKITMDYFNSKEGRNIYRKHLEKDLKSPNTPERGIQNITRILSDFEGHMKGMNDEYQTKVDANIQGTKDFEEFSRNHKKAVLGYIVDLVFCKDGIPPQEEIVFDTLKRLSKKMIMGELGVGAESMDLGLTLDFSVRSAANRHAVLIGQDPEEYLRRLNDQEYKTVVI